jgi:periplasmic protein TonB
VGVRNLQGLSGGSSDWIKYAFVALAIHAMIVAVPVANKATQTAKQKIIEVIVMRQEKLPAPLPAIEKKQPVAKPVLKVKEPEKVADPAPQNKVIEKKEAPPAGGGNAIDERMVAQVTTGPATGGTEGVAVSGVNVGGGKVGTGSGSGSGTARGPVAGAQPVAVQPAPVVETGPIEARIGDADGPQWVYREKPEYPFAARRLGRQGRVDMMVTLDDKGKLLKVDVIHATDESFAQAAVEAVKRSQFAPAKRKGNPVGSRSPFTIHFGL